MNTITVSSPGKLMLLGEHAVVYGRPCLVTAVNQRLRVSVEETNDEIFRLDAPDVGLTSYAKPIKDIGVGDIPKGARFVELAVKNVLEKYNKTLEGIHITSSSEFSSQFGFGSSSAASVCTVFALSKLLHVELSQKEIFDIAYKTVLDIQGKGSGFDVAAAVYGGTIYFVTGGEIIESLAVNELPLVVGYSGIKADTVSLIHNVKEKFKNEQQELDAIYDSIGDLVDKAKGALERKDWVILGNCMKTNQSYLQTLGVSIPKLDSMIGAAIGVGAYGAKLSGAGGGDCMIALCSESTKQEVEKAIEKAGGEILPVVTNAEGMRIEL